jgi:omega-6 fatty acid desaturase (delta-12 desaturase)
VSTPAESTAPGLGAGAQRSWQRTTARYRASNTRRGVVQVCTSILPLIALFVLMYASLDGSYWLTLALSVPTAGFLVRTFVIMHDCGHGSFVPSRRANDIVGFIAGVLTVTPFEQWRRDHAMHHASSGDLDRRGHGDVATLTVEEYLGRTRWGRLKYRMYRSVFVLFVIGPPYILVMRHWRGFTGDPRDRIGVRAADATLGALLVLLSLTVGLKAVALIYVPVYLLAGAVGHWLFYVQHQFQDTYWERHAEWDYADAALRGSSYYRLPVALEWITGSIGLHHVHHIDPRIPNYNLRRCHEENDEFHRVTQLTLRESLRTARLKLWDAKRECLVGFDALSTR